MTDAITLKIPKAFAELRQPKRYKVYYGGRGGAKSNAFAATLLTMGAERPLRILCARELQVSIADSVHKLLADIIANYDLHAFYEITQNAIRGANGTEFIFKGLRHNVREIKGLEGIDIAWVEEAQIVSDQSWELLIPSIRKEGSEIWMSFNPKNPTDATWQRFVTNAGDDTIVRKVSWRDNPFFPSVLEAERVKLQQQDADAYAHIWEGDFDTRFSGSVYAKWLKQDRIDSRVKHDPTYPVYTAWDMGYGDATAITFYQVGNGEIFIIDYYENNLEDVKHYCEVLSGKQIIVNERDLDTGKILHWRYGEDLSDHVHRKDYLYHPDSAHFVPHDANKGVLEAGGRSIIEQAREFGVKMFLIPATGQQNSEAALRAILPKCWFNKERTQDLVASLLHYHYEFDEDRGRYGKLPYHDWSSHGADSAEIMARVVVEKTITTKQIEGQQIDRKFHRLRRENNMDQHDPYRLKRTKNRR